jgi:hypothetical protein
MTSLAASSPSNTDLGRLQNFMKGTMADSKMTTKSSTNDMRSDAQLLGAMDREVKKYESLTARRVELQQQLNQSGSESPGSKLSPSKKDPNFNMDFLTARAPLSPATRSSMRSLVDSMSPLSRKVLLESLIEKDVHGSTSGIDSKKKSPSHSSCMKKKSPSKRVKVTPPRVSSSLTSSPSKGGVGRGGGSSTLTMLDFAATTRTRSTTSSSRKGEKGSRGIAAAAVVASPTEIAAQQLTAEIGTLEAELEKLIESKAERQAEKAESTISEISDVSSEMIYTADTHRRGSRRKKKGSRIGGTSRMSLRNKDNKSGGGNGSLAGLGKAYGFVKKKRVNRRRRRRGGGCGGGGGGGGGSRSSNNSSGKAKVMKNREKGWIVSGDRPPASDQRRFVVPDTSKRNTSNDQQKQKELLAASMSTRTIFEYDEVQASRFVASAFGLSPRTAHRATRGLPKSKRPTVKNIQKGRVGFTKTTVNQKLRELEILRRKMNTPKWGFAENRSFFLHHR